MLVDESWRGSDCLASLLSSYHGCVIEGIEQAIRRCCCPKTDKEEESSSSFGRAQNRV